jgi:hypothetical protein
MLDQQLIERALLDGSRDSLPMLRPEFQRSQDQQVQRSLQKRQSVSG